MLYHIKLLINSYIATCTYRSICRHVSQPKALMVSTSFRLFLSIQALHVLVLLIITQALDLPPNGDTNFCFNDRGNYTNVSTYQTNLNGVLSTLISNRNGTGFYSSSRSSFSSGQNPGDDTDTVYATGVCRGDNKVDACGKCLSDSTYLLTNACPNQKEAIGCFDNCTLRYSNRSLYGVMESAPALISLNSRNVSSPDAADEFKQRLTALFETLTGEAASGSDVLKFAVGNLNASKANKTIYAHAQCTPDLTELDCKNCLDDAYGSMKKYSHGNIGGRVCTPSCNFRFEVYRFIELQEVQLSDPNIPPLPSSNTTISLGSGMP